LPQSLLVENILNNLVESLMGKAKNLLK